MLKLCCLGSGSGGNCIALSSGGATLLIDAGFSAIAIARRMRRAGLQPDSVVALILSHEHTDHVAGASTFALRHRVPVYATEGTFKKTPSLRRHGVTFRVIAPDWPMETAAFKILPFLVPHDAAQPVGFLVDVEGARIGVTTDLGHVPSDVRTRWLTADFLVAESNHDVDMLRLGPYPQHLKDRVLSPRGHLSNAGLADFLMDRTRRPLRHLLLAHLSKTNNDPSLALMTARTALDGAPVNVTVASQDVPTPVIEV